MTDTQTEAALAAIYALRRAKDEATNGVTASARFIDQEVLIALGTLERAFLPTATAVSVDERDTPA